MTGNTTDDLGVNNSTTPDPMSDIPAYALGALSDTERAQVDALLATSEAARAELRTYQDMLSGMATLVPARKTPPHLSQDFRQRLAAEANARQPVKPIEPVILMRRGRNRITLLAAIAAILVVAMGVVGLYRIAVVDAERRTIEGILADSGARWTDLAPQPGTTGTSGKVSFVRLPQNPKAVLVAQLPALPAEKQYQLWLIKQNHPDSALVFSPSQQDNRWLINLPDAAQNYDAAAITVEPMGGSPGPTTKPVYVGAFAP